MIHTMLLAFKENYYSNFKTARPDKQFSQTEMFRFFDKAIISGLINSIISESVWPSEIVRCVDIMTQSYESEIHSRPYWTASEADQMISTIIFNFLINP